MWLMFCFACTFSCRDFGAAIREKSRQKLLPCRQQKAGLLYRWHEHASCWYLWNSAASYTSTPTSGLRPLVRISHALSTSFAVGCYQSIKHSSNCLVFIKSLSALPFLAACRYDRQKLTLKEIHNTQYVSCMNPTAGSFSINPRLQV